MGCAQDSVNIANKMEQTSEACSLFSLFVCLFVFLRLLATAYLCVQPQRIQISQHTRDKLKDLPFDVTEKGRADIQVCLCVCV